MIRDGEPLTDSSGTPYVGFDIVVDTRKATRASTEQFRSAVARRQSTTVANHHCGSRVKYVIDARNLYPLTKAPFFDPPPSGRRRAAGGKGDLDEIVRAFHNSEACEQANRSLIGRRDALDRAWERFGAVGRGGWPASSLAQARHLDYAMRTALFEGHLDRGCNAYGACERDIVALSIRNRGKELCLSGQGCSRPGDFEGVASKVSQYNIWDEYLTQVSGLTSCFLRTDLDGTYYDKIRAMYEQSVGDVQRILFGDDTDLREIFPGESLSDLKALRHYYHAPAMGKCFPNDPRVEYISAAVARKGSDYALLVNTRIRADAPKDGGYLFRDFSVKEADDRDVTSVVDRYPGFVVDGRKVDLKGSSGCAPYGIPPGCRFKDIRRYRRTPSWLSGGRPLEISCRVRARSAACQGPETLETVRVGETCDTQMRPVAGIR